VTGPQPPPPLFGNAAVWRHPEAEARGLGASRSYALALAPQIVHTKSRLLSQLVSSRAYRQVEFLSVGAFFVYEPVGGGEESSSSGGSNNNNKNNGDDAAAVAAAVPKLSRVPSSREDIFSSASIPAKAKRGLMKALKFVLDHDSADEQRAAWQAAADAPLGDFLASQFKLEPRLRNHMLALTLRLDGGGRVTVRDGLAILHRHLTSTGLFGPGFCAVYPKWGGLSEVAQVGCRAGAVGGGIYMLGTRMEAGADVDAQGHIPLALSNDMAVQASTLVGARDTASTGDAGGRISRLVAVVKAPLKALFEVTVEGAPTPAVAVVAFPAGVIPSAGDAPVYALVHSSDTGECPVGQCKLHFHILFSSRGYTLALPDGCMMIPTYKTYLHCLSYALTINYILTTRPLHKTP
jgi:Rab proteins geranylgeranyltransferase component A